MALTSEERKRFGVGKGPVSSTEMARAQRAIKNKKETEAGGGTYVTGQDIFNAFTKGKKSAADSLGAGAGAGAGGSGPNALDRFTRQLQAMLTGGSYGKPYDDLQTNLANLNQQASGTINSSMDALKTALQGQANPYANFQAQSTQVSPELSQLLASQGVPTTPLEQMAAATQAQNTGQATAFQNLVGSLGTIYGANQAGQISDVDAQRANLQNMLAQQAQGMGAQLAEKKQGRQSELLTMLLSSLAKGGRPNAGRLF